MNLKNIEALLNHPIAQIASPKSIITNINDTESDMSENHGCKQIVLPFDDIEENEN